MTLYIPLKIRNVSKEHIAKQETNGSACSLLHGGFFFGLFFNTEDGGDMLLRNVGLFSTDYTALYSRR
jgi:hypothetical protein